MKTKILFTVFFVFAISVNTKISSQEYHPLLNNSSWIVTGVVACCEPPETKVVEQGTDEVIGGKTYKKFINPFLFGDNPVIYLREDTAEHKVYRMVNGTEVLIYDFSLNNSDTIVLHGVTFTATVDEINVVGGVRKRITLKSGESDQFCGKSATEVWIEGVGSVSHPFDPGFNIGAESCSGGGFRVYTTCSFQNGKHIFGSSNCISLLSTEDFSLEADDIQLFPNPASDLVNVHFQNSSETLETITVYNLVGKIVQKVSALSSGQHNFSVGSLPKGLYLVEIITQNRIKTTKKLIVN